MPVRIALAAGILLFAWWLSDRVRGLDALVHTNPARLGFEMMGIGLGLAVFAVGIAVALPGGVAHRLGLGRSRLPIGAAIAFTLGTLGLAHVIDAVLTLSAPRAVERSVAMGISRGFAGPSGWDFAIALIGSAIAPAIGEELLCRGLLQRSLARVLGPVAAVAGSALFFGWLHGELVHGAIATCLGAYIGVAAYWSDSTRPAIAAHATNNAVALLGSMGLLSLAVPPVPGLLVGLGLAALGLVCAWRSRRRDHPEGAPRPQKAALQPGSGPADA